MDSFDCTVDADGSLHLTAKRSRGPATGAGAAAAASDGADAALRERIRSHAAASTSTAVASSGRNGGACSDDSGEEELDWLTPEQLEVSFCPRVRFLWL
jgi:hypothetical protein